MDFFKRVKSWCNGDKGGRYMSLVLCELFADKKSKKLVKELFGEEINFERLDTENSYIEGRRADIAFLDKKDEIVALAEVKHEDQNNKGNRAQLKDYCKSQVPFIVITKKSLPKEYEKELGEKQIISYGDIARKIKGLKLDSEIARMVSEYLKGEALMFTKINDIYLKILLTGGSTEKFNRKDTLQAPDTLKNFINNMATLGDYVYKEYIDGIQANKPKLYFSFVSKPKGSNQEAILDSYCQFNLYDRNYRETDKGYFLHVLVGIKSQFKDGKLKTILYAKFNPKGKNLLSQEEKINLGKITEDVAFKKITGLLKKVIKDSSKKKFPSHVSKHLKRLEKNFANQN
ncbi:MAG: hypothetical protein NTW04_03950 [Elusimicrobia bacterium]|nr:hypothetical protein [Elusimicrobiota bacterium]